MNQQNAVVGLLGGLHVQALLSVLLLEGDDRKRVSRAARGVPQAKLQAPMLHLGGQVMQQTSEVEKGNSMSV